MFDIPILTYHKVSDQTEFGITTVSTYQFDRQMEYLDSDGYVPVCLKDIIQNAGLPEKPVIITFDDGYESIYQNAKPVLDKYGFKAVIFIVTDYIGQFNLWEAVPIQQKFRHLSQNQILALKNDGHEIASHSQMHNYLPSLKTDALMNEINGSKINLESMLGERITSFCYPYGKFSKKIIQIVEKSGYHFATTNLRFSKRRKNNRFLLPRRSIYKTDSLNTFKSKLNSPSSLNLAYLSEVLVQKGALASIGVNILRRSKSHF